MGGSGSTRGAGGSAAPAQHGQDEEKELFSAGCISHGMGNTLLAARCASVQHLGPSPSDDNDFPWAHLAMSPICGMSLAVKAGWEEGTMVGPGGVPGTEVLHGGGDTKTPLDLRPGAPCAACKDYRRDFGEIVSDVLTAGTAILHKRNARHADIMTKIRLAYDSGDLLVSTDSELEVFREEVKRAILVDVVDVDDALEHCQPLLGGLDEDVEDDRKVIEAVTFLALSFVEYSEGDLVYFGKTNWLRERTTYHYYGTTTKKEADMGNRFAGEEYAAHYNFGYKIASTIIITSALSTQDAMKEYDSSRSAERQVRRGVAKHAQNLVAAPESGLLYYRMKDSSKGGEFVFVVLVDARVDILNQQFLDALQTGTLTAHGIVLPRGCSSHQRLQENCQRLPVGTPASSRLSCV